MASVVSHQPSVPTLLQVHAAPGPIKTLPPILFEAAHRPSQLITLNFAPLCHAHPVIPRGGAAYKSLSASLSRLQTSVFRLRSHDAPSALDLIPRSPFP